MDNVDRSLRQMLLDIANAFSDGGMLTFLEFTKLTIAVLEDAIDSKPLLESAKAQLVYELWRDYAAGRKRASAPLPPDY